MAKEYMGFSSEQRQTIISQNQHNVDLLKSIIGHLPDNSEALYSDCDGIINHHFVDYLIALSGGEVFEEVFLDKKYLFGIETVLTSTVEDIYIDLTCLADSRQHFINLPIMHFLRHYISFMYDNQETWIYNAYRSILVDFEAAIDHTGLALYGVIHAINAILGDNAPNRLSNIERRRLSKYINDLAYVFSSTSNDVIVARDSINKPQDDISTEIKSALSTEKSKVPDVDTADIFKGDQIVDIIEEIKHLHSSPYDNILEIWWRTHRVEGVSSDKNLGIMLNATVKILKDLFTPIQMNYIKDNLDVNYVFGSLFGTLVNNHGKLDDFTTTQLRVFTLVDALVDISSFSEQSIHEETLKIYKALDMEFEIPDMISFIDDNIDKIDHYLENAPVLTSGTVN